MKSLISLILICVSLYAQVEFKETKYISALDMDLLKYGNLQINDDILTIVYTKPKNEKIIYFEDRIEISNGDDIKVYNFEKYPKAQFMGLILRAIIEDNYMLVDNLFKVTNKKNIIILTAKPIISDYIDTITIKNKLQYNIVIEMINKDKITIETSK